MRDGVELATFVYGPNVEGAFPVLLVRTPYNAALGGEDALEWVRRGFVFVRQDVRGRFLSDGEWVPCFNEKEDAQVTLDWIAAQPWCDGNIAMYGGSYPGVTQTAAALTGHPALKCITPALSPARFYNMFYNSGVPRVAWQTAWTLPLKIVEDREKVQRHLPLLEMDVYSGGEKLPFWRKMLANPYETEIWREYSIPEQAFTIQAPAFIRTGWFDLFMHDTFEYFNALREHGGNEKTRRFTRLLVGPWPHNINQQKTGDVDFGEQAIVEDLMDQEVSFIRNMVSQTPQNPQTAPLRIFVMGSNEWRDEYEWPLARTTWTDLFLASKGGANTAAGDGILTDKPDGKADRFHYDPADPVPTHGGAWGFSDVGFHDQREVEKRQDVLVYTSPPLPENTEVTGPISVVLFASSSARDTDFTAKLVDMQPDETPMSITDGIIRARFKNGREELLVPGEVNEFRIYCNPTSYVFKKGQRIRLEISSSNFPAFASNLNTGGDIPTESQARIAQQTIFHSAEYPSRIILPIIKADSKKADTAKP